MLVRPSTFYHTVVSAVVHLSASVLLHQLEEGLRGHQTRAGEGPRELNPTILLFRGRRRLLLAKRLVVGLEHRRELVEVNVLRSGARG